ncbi:MAG: tRNA (adenosine(37)-N6)-threonylcarbamoyltransferase complex ATPase subunit type 1 TsaE [Rhodospirillales bacterium]|nr:tRNA (adenosine(37)-N6)-threonylcarbamoyltransferase complex ATPase subunit type 1 TsaE [Rhodospirillales bacterium]
MSAPKPRSASLSFDLPDLSATAELARRLAALVRPGDVIALAGDLGSGKTSFARAFIKALPVPEGGAGEAAEEEVPSPTFTLVQIYRRAPADVWHFDLYRLERPEEAYELGIEDAFAGAISLIEWPDRLGALLPAEHLEVALSFGASPQARHAALTGSGAWAARLAALEPLILGTAS